MSDASRAVLILRRRLALALFARYALLYAAAAFLACGVALLLLKRSSVIPPAWPFTLALVLAAIVAAIHGRRRMPSRAATIALLDARSHAGGLLMAGDAMPLGAWTPAVAAIPRVSWRARRQVALTAVCAAFLAVAAVVPAPARTTRHALAIEADVEKLAERIELLKEENVLPAERAGALQEELEALQRDAAGEDPAKTWEALDSIDESTLRSASEAAAQAVQKADELTKTEATTLALTDGGLDPETLAAAMADPETRAALGGQPLSSEQMRELGASARAQRAKLRASLQKLSDRSLIDPKALRDFDEASAVGNRQELAKYLKACNHGTPLGDVLGEWRRSAPGISRGRADAPMFFGEEAEQNGKFDEQTLPPAAAAALAQSELVAVSAAAPAEDGGRSRPGALAGAQAGGGSALTPAVQPRHRGTVERYFDRKPQ